MSLRSVTQKIDGLIQGAVFLLTLGIWAAAGFPFTSKIVVSGCVLIGGLIVVAAYKWIAPRL
jgi:hypothetical protein